MSSCRVATSPLSRAAARPRIVGPRSPPGSRRDRRRTSHGRPDERPAALRPLEEAGGGRDSGLAQDGRAGGALAQPGGGNREADHRPRGEDRRRGRSHRRDAQAAGGADGRRSKGPRVIGVTIESIQVGDSAQLTRRVADQDIAEFVDAVGDYNPVHSDRDYAASTMFKEPIAPGIWTAGLISAVIGTRLPGPGAIYLSQDLKFLKPVKFNDVITARVEVVETMRERNRVRLKTVCTNQRGEEVLTGEALVMPSKTRVDYEATSRQAMGALALWMLAPWAWAAQGAAVVGMLGLAALGLSSPQRGI